MQVKTTMTYHYTPIRIAKSRTLKTPNAGEDVEQKELSFIAGGNAKWYNHFGRQFGSFLQTYGHTKTCTWMFMVALFKLSKFGSNQDVLQ